MDNYSTVEGERMIIIRPLEDCDLCFGTGALYVQNGQDGADKNICECILRQEEKFEMIASK